MNKSSKKTSTSDDPVILEDSPQEITGAYLRGEREKLGLTQERMAGLFRVTLNTYSRWERGRFLPHASGAIWMALEYLKYKRYLDSDLLRTLDERMAETEALNKRLDEEREEFERSLGQ